MHHYTFVTNTLYSVLPHLPVDSCSVHNPGPLIAMVIVITTAYIMELTFDICTGDTCMVFILQNLKFMRFVVCMCVIANSGFAEFVKY